MTCTWTNAHVYIGCLNRAEATSQTGILYICKPILHAVVRLYQGAADMYIQTHDKNLILQCLWSPTGNISYAEDTVDLPTPIFNGPNEATEPEAPIRLYIREAALYEKVLEAIPPWNPGWPPGKIYFIPKCLVKYLCVHGLFTLVLY